MDLLSLLQRIDRELGPIGAGAGVGEQQQGVGQLALVAQSRSEPLGLAIVADRLLQHGNRAGRIARREPVATEVAARVGVLMAQLFGMTSAEIAADTGKSEAAVRTALSRALADLARLL